MNSSRSLAPRSSPRSPRSWPKQSPPTSLLPSGSQKACERLQFRLEMTPGDPERPRRAGRNLEEDEKVGEQARGSEDSLSPARSLPFLFGRADVGLEQPRLLVKDEDRPAGFVILEEAVEGEGFPRIGPKVFGSASRGGWDGPSLRKRNGGYVEIPGRDAQWSLNSELFLPSGSSAFLEGRPYNPGRP